MENERLQRSTFLDEAVIYPLPLCKRDSSSEELHSRVVREENKNTQDQGCKKRTKMSNTSAVTEPQMKLWEHEGQYIRGFSM